MAKFWPAFILFYTRLLQVQTLNYVVWASYHLLVLQCGWQLVAGSQ
jgi:hypothetical protein